MTTKSTRMAVTALAATLVAGCATVPTGPYIAALPGSRATPQQFSADDTTCRAQAQAYFGPYSAQPANDAAAATAVASTLLVPRSVHCSARLLATRERARPSAAGWA